MYRSAELRYGQLKERAEAQAGELRKLTVRARCVPRGVAGRGSRATGEQGGRGSGLRVGAAGARLPACCAAIAGWRWLVLASGFVSAGLLTSEPRCCILLPALVDAGGAGGGRGRVRAQPVQAEERGVGAGRAGQPRAQQQQGGQRCAAMGAAARPPGGGWAGAAWRQQQPACCAVRDFRPRASPACPSHSTHPASPEQAWCATCASCPPSRPCSCAATRPPRRRRWRASRARWPRWPGGWQSSTASEAAKPPPPQAPGGWAHAGACGLPRPAPMPILLLFVFVLSSPAVVVPALLVALPCARSRAL